LKLLTVLKERLLYALLATVLERHGRFIRKQEEILHMNDRAIELIASSVKDCAEQLATHTEAVKGMASASQELLETVREMNRILECVNPDGARTKYSGHLVHRLR